MKDCTYNRYSPILPAQTSNNTSSSLPAPEHVGPQLVAGHTVLGHKFDSRPPLRVEPGLGRQPVGNGLLADSRPIEEVSDAPSKGDLASGDVDSASKGDNVRLLHSPEFTRILVDVNKDRHSTVNKGSCSVVDMQTVRKKRAPAPSAKPKPSKKARPLEVGPDGLTMPARLKLAMLERKLDPERGGQSKLARECQRIYANGRDNAPATIQQGHIWELLNGQGTGRYLSIVARVLGVNCLWLQFGIGPKYPTSTPSTE